MLACCRHRREPKGKAKLVSVMSATKTQINTSAIAAESSLVMTQYVAKLVLIVTAMPRAKREKVLRMEASTQNPLKETVGAYASLRLIRCACVKTAALPPRFRAGGSSGPKPPIRAAQIPHLN